MPTARALPALMRKAAFHFEGARRSAQLWCQPVCLYRLSDSLDNKAVSRTLEHGVDDYCIALMADKMGKRMLCQLLKGRAIIKPATVLPGRCVAKDSKGNWRKDLIRWWPLPGEQPGWLCTEANAWQYFWTPAQYDVEGMTRLLGGRKQFTDQLTVSLPSAPPNPNGHLAGGDDRPVCPWQRA